MIKRGLKCASLQPFFKLLIGLFVRSQPSKLKMVYFFFFFSRKPQDIFCVVEHLSMVPEVEHLVTEKQRDPGWVS